MMPYKSSIYPFIGIAVLVHIALGLTFLQSESQAIISSQDNNGISVTLTQNKISVQAKKPVPHKINKSNLKNKIKNESDTSKNVPQNKQIAETKEAKSIDSSARIIGHIKDEIKYHFFYPRIAQKRNWQGTVTLNLRINKTGEIKNISIITSSGHNILDDAALEVLNKIRNKNFLAHIVNNEKTILLPITYQLTEG